jgi:hypothetical protein
MAHQAPLSPDARKKKPALPFLLSNLRNAQAAIVGVAGSTEGRPLMGINSPAASNTEDSNGINYAIERSNMKRNVAVSASSNARTSSAQDPATTRLNTGGNAPSSLSSTLSSISIRFENSWRKRYQHLHKEDDSIRHNTKRRRPIRVSIPNAFLLSSICFFIGVPLLVLLYVLARKSVFGDEGGNEVGGDHRYEVKTFDVNAGSVEEKQVLVDVTSQMGDGKEISTKIDTLNILDSESLVAPPNKDGSDNSQLIDKVMLENSWVGTDGVSPQQSDVSIDNADNSRGHQATNIEKQTGEEISKISTETEENLTGKAESNIMQDLDVVSGNIIDSSAKDNIEDTELRSDLEQVEENRQDDDDEEAA